MDLLLNYDYLKILDWRFITERAITIRCQNKSESFIGWMLLCSWRNFLVSFLNVWETFYDTENYPNVSQTLYRQKLILQDCTYQKLQQNFQKWRLQSRFGIGFINDPLYRERVRDRLPYWCSTLSSIFQKTIEIAENWGKYRHLVNIFESNVVIMYQNKI